jgi:predicted nucleotidyltransferase
VHEALLFELETPVVNLRRLAAAIAGICQARNVSRSNGLARRHAQNEDHRGLTALKRTCNDNDDGPLRSGWQPRVSSRGSYTTSVASDSNRQLALTEFVKRLRHHLSGNVVDVRLFGSEARGEATPESDIDVLVVVQPDGQRVAFEDRIIDLAFDVNLDFGVYISPRVITPGILNDPVWRETSFIKNVADQSIPL